MQFIKVPPLELPTLPSEQFDEVMRDEDYVRIATMGLAIQRLLRDGVVGSIAEVGVWRGECARFMHMFAPDRALYLFDTFEGFPKIEGSPEDDRFRDTDIDVVLDTVGRDRNVFIRKGIFPETVSGLEDEWFSFVSLDLDTYEGIRSGWEFFYPRVPSGGYIFVHDFNSLEYDRGPFRASTEFLADKAEKLIEIPDHWGSAVLRKI